MRVRFLVLALLASGCGGEKAGTPAPAPAPSPGGPRFEEIAEKAGLRFRTTFLRQEQGENFNVNLYDHGSGVAVADVDGDGDDDVYLLNQLGPNALFRNRGDGTFEEITAEAGVALEERISVAAAFGDADGDGDQDLYVTTVRGGNAYFENQGGGKFRDATREAGLRLVAESMGATWFDMDGDGDLDLFVTNTGHWTEETFDQASLYYPGKRTLAGVVRSGKIDNVLYANDGKGRFTDVTEAAGVQGRGWADDAEIFDMDGDGDPDIYVTDMFGANTLYRNEGGGRFADVTRTALGRTSWGATGARTFDYDGDGLLDLFVADMHSDMWMDMDGQEDAVEERRKYRSFLERPIALGLKTAAQEKEFELLAGVKNDEVVFGNTLFRNKGGGAFEEVSDRAGVETLWPWGVAEGDYDGDGWIDLFLPSGMGFPFFYWRNALLRNRGNGTFEEVSGRAGMDPPPGGKITDVFLRGLPSARSSRCAATGDFDGDGRLDLVVSNFNDRAYYFRNVSPAVHWCELDLVGTGGNRAAVGAFVRLAAVGRTQVRQVQAAGGYLSQSSNRLHFGLGAAAAVDRVEVRWPDGTTQVVEHPPVDRRSTITKRP